MGNRIVIIGAGSTNFGLGIVGDFFKSKILEGATLVLHDINAKTLENTKNIALSYKEKLGVNFEIQATTSRSEALKGAHFCLISIKWVADLICGTKIGKPLFSMASNKFMEKTEALEGCFMQWSSSSNY